MERKRNPGGIQMACEMGAPISLSLHPGYTDFTGGVVFSLACGALR